MDNLTPSELKRSLKSKFFIKAYSSKLILASFLIIILIGTLLLSSTSTTLEPISLFQAFFTSVSMTCVTGLKVVDISIFNDIGKVILLFLMQIGGLGLMTLSFFLVSIFYHDLGVATSSIAKDFLSISSVGQVKKHLALIIKITFGVEAISAFLFFCKLSRVLPFSKALFLSIFHAVSFFCNVGVICDQDLMQPFLQDKSFLFIAYSLSILGGLGFFVLYELFYYFKNILNEIIDPCCVQKNLFKFSLHSKIVLRTSFVLLLLGMCIVFSIERHNAWGKLSYFDALWNAFFYSASLRSLGFFSGEFSSFSDATYLLSLLWMMIGASPGSTGGGIKTTTFTIFWIAILSVLRNKTFVEIDNRTIRSSQVLKATSIVAISFAWLFVSTFFLMVFESKFSFLGLLLESAAAISNVGLSFGIADQFCRASQLVLILNMIAGRIGLLTFIFAIRQNKERQMFKLAEEEVILG